MFLLPAGHVADRYDRRQVILVCYAFGVLCTLTLLIFALQGLHRVAPIFAVLFLIGSGRAFSGPASSALLPHLVSTVHFVNAITWGATVFQIANIAGPAVGGLLYTLPLKGEFYGAPIVFLFTLVTGISFVLLIGSLHVRPGRMDHRAISVDVILAGFHYVWKSRLLLGSISLDLFVVLLGGATALLPIFAHDILRTGPQGLGALRSAPALGALAVSIWLTFRPVLRRPGRAHVHRRRCLWRGPPSFSGCPQLAPLIGCVDGGRSFRHGQRGSHPVVHAATGDALARCGEE